METQKAHIIVVGNEKGGSGKSTVAVHLAIGLLKLGYKVATIDVDSHQATFTQFMKNRWAYIRDKNDNLALPEHIHLHPQSREEAKIQLEGAIHELESRNDFILIDTPGSDRFVGILAHSFADTLVTPINDSPVDLDLLAKTPPEAQYPTAPGLYTQMVWDVRWKNEQHGKNGFNWFVVRNRLALSTRVQSSETEQKLKTLQTSLGFTLLEGFSERQIFRTLFQEGRTLLDLHEDERKRIDFSGLGARLEVRHLVRSILPHKDVSTLALLKAEKAAAQSA